MVKDNFFIINKVDRIKVQYSAGFVLKKEGRRRDIHDVYFGLIIDWDILRGCMHRACLPMGKDLLDERMAGILFLRTSILHSHFVQFLHSKQENRVEYS
jgi:hypothetical protein